MATKIITAEKFKTLSDIYAQKNYEAQGQNLDKIASDALKEYKTFVDRNIAQVSIETLLKWTQELEIFSATNTFKKNHLFQSIEREMLLEIEKRNRTQAKVTIKAPDKKEDHPATPVKTPSKPSKERSCCAAFTRGAYEFSKAVLLLPYRGLYAAALQGSRLFKAIFSSSAKKTEEVSKKDLKSESSKAQIKGLSEEPSKKDVKEEPSKKDAKTDKTERPKTSSRSGKDDEVWGKQAKDSKNAKDSKETKKEERGRTQGSSRGLDVGFPNLYYTCFVNAALKLLFMQNCPYSKLLQNHLTKGQNETEEHFVSRQDLQRKLLNLFKEAEKHTIGEIIAREYLRDIVNHKLLCGSQKPFPIVKKGDKYDFGDSFDVINTIMQFMEMDRLENVKRLSLEVGDATIEGMAENTVWSNPLMIPNLATCRGNSLQDKINYFCSKRRDETNSTRLKQGFFRLKDKSIQPENLIFCLVPKTQSFQSLHIEKLSYLIDIPIYDKLGVEKIATMRASLVGFDCNVPNHWIAYTYDSKNRCWQKHDDDKPVYPVEDLESSLMQMYKPADKRVNEIHCISKLVYKVEGLYQQASI